MSVVANVKVVAVSRSQNVRIGTAKVPSISEITSSANITPVTVNLVDPVQRRDLQRHLAIGAVIVVHSTYT